MPLTSVAQDVTVRAEYPSVVRAGEQFSIVWTINTSGGDFTAPSFEGFYKLMGPQTSYSSSTQFINGKMSQQTSYSYMYYLQALNPGKYVLGPGKYTLRNKTFNSDSIYIEVVPGSSSGLAGTRSSESATEVENAGGDIFVGLSVNKREAFVGEHIVATVKLYTKIDISGINEIKYPSFTGFLRTDLETPPLSSLREENVNGEIYGTGVLQEFLIYPQTSGELTIDPVQLTVLVRQRSGQSDPFFGDFFATYTTVPRAVVSQPVKISVKALPAGRPSDFSGVVGKLSLKGVISKDTVNVNDAVNLKLILSGSGNIKLAGAPELQLPPDIETYDPKITDNLKSSLSGTSGERVFEYLLIPRHHGDFTIPAIRASYFDISTGKYVQLSTGPFSFHAVKGEDQPGGITVFGGVSREDVQFIGKDIRFIKQSPAKLKKNQGTLSSKRSFYSSYAIIFLIFTAILIARREHVKRNSDISAVKNRRAAKIAASRLRKAHECLKKSDSDRFYDEILKAVWGYLGDKLNIPLSELTRTNALETLGSRGISNEDTAELLNILDKCEYARYAPSATASEAGQIYDSTVRFIKSVENSLQ